MPVKNSASLITLILLAFWLLSCSEKPEEAAEFEANKVLPSASQLAYHPMEMVGFIHFTVNTFTDKEWGYGDEDPAIFNPTEPDAEQWVKVAKDAGLKQLILTAKHHDGFCLWPSEFTEHSVKNSPYKNGKGDIVGEMVEACRKHGLKVGLYLSPWDRNHKDYGTEAYITYYRNQLTELLSNYGEINEIWFDGANGGDGYYGGANEVRKIDRSTYYDWDSTFALVKSLQPNISIFSDAGPDIHWIGNEHGFAGDPFWNMIKSDQLVIGGSNTAYLNSGDPEGDEWIIGQCDVSIRPGWFYHESQDSEVKSLNELLEIYYKSVGRGAVLLLNLPPDKRGLIHENDVRALSKFRQTLNESFNKNLLEGARIKATSTFEAQPRFAAEKCLDPDMVSFWAAEKADEKPELVIDLDNTISFDRIVIQEPIAYGQRITGFEVYVMNNDNWELITTSSTIGYKRILQLPLQQTGSLRFVFSGFNNIPAISNIEVYKASPRESI